jgi:hypothetical protein
LDKEINLKILILRSNRLRKIKINKLIIHSVLITTVTMARTITTVITQIILITKYNNTHTINQYTYHPPTTKNNNKIQQKISNS